MVDSVLPLWLFAPVGQSRRGDERDPCRARRKVVSAEKKERGMLLGWAMKDRQAMLGTHAGCRDNGLSAGTSCVAPGSWGKLGLTEIICRSEVRVSREVQERGDGAG